MAFLSQQVRYITTVDEDIGHEAVVDVSSMRDDADLSTMKQLF